MKGQMFIITMVFLVGLIFAVQNNLSQYTFLDLSTTFEKSDFYILKSIKDSFYKTIKSARNCQEAQDNVNELKDFFENKIIEGTSIQIDQEWNCPGGWSANPLNLTIRLKSIEIDTREELVLTR